jgi:bla regulator protein BlaR1
MHLLNDQAVQVICWTLIHSVWEGLILSILAGIAILFTRKSAAAVRYNLLSLLSIMFLVCAGITFEMQLQHANENIRLKETTLQLNVTEPQHPVLQNPVRGSNQYVADFISYFNSHATIVVTGWFIVMSFQFVRLFGNYLYTQRVRNYKTHQPPPYWKTRLRFLAKRLHINGKVGLMESEIIKVPVLVGFFKPVILFPFSLMSQLPPEQVEAVLLHELAHIRRKDYFVNLMQRIAEIIFFFNPGFVWVSSLIRDERENCCDDIAIAKSNDRKELIHALISFEEYHNAPHEYALAFAGKKNHLLNRIKRIISNNNKTLSNMEKISLFSCIVIAAMATLAFQQNTQNPFPALTHFDNKLLETKVSADTIPDKINHPSTSQFVMTIDGIKYKYVEIEGKAPELYANGKLIPPGTMTDYQREVMSKIKQEQAGRMEKLSAENKKMQTQEIELQDRVNKLNSESEMINRQKIKANEDAMQELMKQEQELAMKMDYLRKTREALFMDEWNKKHFEEQAQFNKKQAELYELQFKIKDAELRSSSKSYKETEDKEQSDLLQKKENEMKAQIESQRNLELIGSGPAETLLRLNGGVLRLIINALLDEKIIDSRNDLTIILNQQTFTVNGKVQPPNIQDEFKKRFLSRPKDHVIYSRHGGSTSADIDIDDNPIGAEEKEKP